MPGIIIITATSWPPPLILYLTVWGFHPYFTAWLLFWNRYLIQNSQAVKKQCGPQKGYGEKRCEIQGGGQEMVVMVG